MHIQDPSLASSFEKHWGYPDRSVPCTNDAGSCEYLDAVYWMHDVSMLYIFILWAVLGGIFIIWGLFRVGSYFSRRKAIKEVGSQKKVPGQSTVDRSWRASTAFFRHHLLPELSPQTTRLQVLILSILLTYLLIFSLIGIVYKTWITPVKAHPGKFNTRVGLGGFADRVGALAYALTPVTVFLSTRESLLTLITGIPYQHFNFLHRWTGRIIFIQSFLHTLGWTIIEGRLYQPQPMVFREFISETYIIWGVVGMLLLTFLYIFSIRAVIRWTGYEFFHITHVVVAGVYIGACWAHWSKLACWMIASISIILLDRWIRLIRLALIHFGKLPSGRFGFSPAKATLTLLPTPTGPVIHLSFTSPNPKVSWKAGQHFFLTFPALSIWQAHPFTVLSSPSPHPSRAQKHTYIIRPLSGQTSALASLADSTGKTDVILVGPYGSDVLGPERGMERERKSTLCVAGGTGISFSLPVAREAARRRGVVSLVWVAREARDLKWIGGELDAMRASGEKVRVRVFVTRGAGGVSSPSVSGDEKVAGETAVQVGEKNVEEGIEIVYLNSRPEMDAIVAEFLERHEREGEGGAVQVVGSGPVEIGTDLRAAIAGCNDAGEVWRRKGAGDVEFYWDHRVG